MANYSRDNYLTLIEIIKDYFGFDVQKVHEYVVEFYYGNEVPLFRLIFIEETGTLAVSFHVELVKSDAFEIMNYIKDHMPEIKLSEEYIVDEDGQTLLGQEAYVDYERQLLEHSKNTEIDEIEYVSEVPVTITVPHAIYHAQDPRSLEVRKQLEQQFRYFGKFTWKE